MKTKTRLLTLTLPAFALIFGGVLSLKPNREFNQVSADSSENYYQNADTSTKQNLASSLHSIISSNTVDVGYNGLWDAYRKTDVKPGTTDKVWDMYSNETYTYGSSQQGRSYSKEGDAFNREHTIPQSWFNEKSPMKSDLFHVYPTDGFVNGKRSNYPHGEVGNATYTSKNGSKLGTSSYSGISGTVFEPIDEFKGDFARTYFYFAIRYSDKTGSFGNLFQSSFPYIKSSYASLYLKWAKNDPVSIKETTRNDAVYGIQGNRNPFIDHPEWTEFIFGSGTLSEKKLSSISVTTQPTNKMYTVGDIFNPSGAKITAYYSDATSADVTSAVTWPSTPLALGTTSVTCSYTEDNVTKTAVINDIIVTEQVTHVESVSFAKESLELVEGDQKSFEYTIVPENASNKNVTFNSSNDKVAKVQNNKIIALKEGSTTITITTEDGNKTDTMVVNVSKKVIPVEGIQLNPTEFSLKVGSSHNLTATVLPENASNKNVTWSSDNESVATVDQTGKVTAISEGQATITVKTEEGNFEKSCLITVSPDIVDVPVTGVSLNKEYVEVAEGDDAILIATVLPENATNNNVSWSSEDNEIATVTNGVVTGVAEGETTITVTTEDGSFTASCEVFVTLTRFLADVESVTLNVTNLDLNIGDQFYLVAAVKPDEAADQSVSWESSDPEVVSIDLDGQLTALSLGTSVITVTSVDQDISTTAIVNVVEKESEKPAKLVEIEVVNLPNKIIYQIGESVSYEGLIVEGHYQDGTSKEITGYAMSPVDKTTPGEKEVVIYYTDRSVSYTTTLTLVYVAADKTITKLSVINNPKKTDYFVGQSLLTVGLKIEAEFNDGSKFDATNACTLSPTTFSNTGEVTITASLGEESTSFKVTVLNGSATNVDKANDYTYVFNDYLVDDVAAVTKTSWEILEYKFNLLDSETKKVLKEASSEYLVTRAENTENNSELIAACVKKYDEILIAHKSDKFNDFMNRGTNKDSDGENDLIEDKTFWEMVKGLDWKIDFNDLPEVGVEIIYVFEVMLAICVLGILINLITKH